VPVSGCKSAWNFANRSPIGRYSGTAQPIFGRGYSFSAAAIQALCEKIRYSTALFVDTAMA